MGLPTARSTGLACVKAPYVAHCDSDDYVEPTMYEKLYSCAIQNDSDMVICGRLHHLDGKEHAELDKPLMKESFIYSFLYGRLSPCVWTRLTRTDIYRRVIFPTANICEDVVQTAQLLTFVSRVFFLNELLYHHICRPMSLTTDNRREMIEKKVQQGITNFYLFHDFIMDRHLAKEEDFIIKKESIRFLYLPLIGQSGVCNKYLHTFQEINFCLLVNRRVPLRTKLFHLLVILGLYPVVRDTYHFFIKVFLKSTLSLF